MQPSRKITMSKFKLLPFAAALVLTGIRTAQAADYPTTILADNPSAYYRLEEASGATTAIDATANGLNGAYLYDLDINGNPDYPKLVQNGIDTNSVLFHVYNDTNGVAHTSLIDVPFSSTLNPQGPFSIEFWARPTSDNHGDYATPVGNFGGYGDGSGWHFYQSPGSGTSSGSWIWDVPSAGAFIQTSPVVKNQWTHLVGVYDGANLIFYVNGVATATVPGAGFLANSANDLFIGGDPATGHGYWEGYVDEVAVYTTALSAAKVLAHYQEGTNSFAPMTDLPVVLVDAGEANSNPASTTNNVGSTVVFDPIVVGGTPFAYQWFSNSVIYAGQTGSLLTFPAINADNGSTYYVVVTNNNGRATSEVATLTVSGALFINGGPQSITRNVGSYAAFHVIASGASPITYQWSQSINNGTTFTPIPGATDATLWLSNVQQSQSGYQYAVSVTGPAVSSNVPPATLTVQPRAVNVPLTGYGAVVAADKPVAYWRLDESDGSSTAVDAVGSFDGTYTANAGTITYGVLPPGIPNDTDPAVGIANGATIQVSFAPELNPTASWSVETWVQPSSLGANGGDYRVVLSSEYNLFPNPFNGWYIYQQPNNSFAFVPQPGNAFLSGGSIVANNWYYVVLTDDGVNFNLYVNGVLAVAPLPVAGANFIPNGSGINLDGTPGITDGLGNTVLGQRTDGAFGTFEGTMDDTAIYNYALTPQQIQNHFQNTTRVSITSSGSNIVISWPTGTLQSSVNVNGPYVNVGGATSPYTNSVTGSQKFFRVQVQ
jgi:Concanavalin A-like lectin/glucanases superfamily